MFIFNPKIKPINLGRFFWIAIELSDEVNAAYIQKWKKNTFIKIPLLKMKIWSNFQRKIN